MAAPRRPSARRSPSFAAPLAVALIALAAAAVVAAVLLAGGGDENPSGKAGTPGKTASAERRTRSESTPTQSAPAEQAPAEPAPAEPAPEQPADTGIDVDPARGIALNEQGFALMGQGDFAGAVPILQKAVASWPEDSTDINYAYALYNLGTSLNRSGRSAEAIPYLEKRLNWPNQRGVVKQELRLARQNAGQG